jgi:lysophospholipase L1-like esterase
LAAVCVAWTWLVAPLHAQEAEKPAQRFPSPLARLDVQDGDTVVFLGDSITHQRLYTQYVENFFFTRYPDRRVRLHNAGIGGARAWDALRRFDRDVAAYKPKYVTVLLGMNDGSYRPFDQAVFDTYQKDMTELIDRITDTGAVPVLMSPTMYDARAALLRDAKRPAETVDLYNSVLAYYGEWLRRVAEKEGHGYVDMHGPLNNLTLEERKTKPDFTMIRDAVHPDAPGQAVMAYAMIDQLGLGGPLSGIRIEKSPKGNPVARGTGGKVSELEVTDDGLTFTWTADALPWVLPTEARVGVELTRLGHRASREALEVHDLPAGNYRLTIDDEPVGVYSDQQLARHIELQGNPATPQYKQALRVAELNKQRNEGPVKKLRDDWFAFQALERAKRDFGDGGTDEQKKQMAELQVRVDGLDERIREYEAESQRFLDQIYEANKPQPRRYRLERVEPAEVSGTVTLDGKPLARARVTFRGQDLPGVAVGTTNEAGQYIALTNGLPGVTPGEYRVTVVRVGAADVAALPTKYSDPKATSLAVTVKQGANSFDLNLNSQ